MNKQRAVETFVSRANEARLHQFEQLMNATVEQLFEKVKAGDYLDYLYKIYNAMVKEQGVGFDNLYDILFFILMYSCRDDEQLYDAFLNEDEEVLWLVHYLSVEAVSSLGEKLARYYEEKLGFPPNSLAYRYNLGVPVSAYGDIIDVLGHYEFALCLDKSVKEGDWIGDWLVVKNNVRDTKHPRIRISYKGKESGTWAFWRTDNKENFVLPRVNTKEVDVFEGTTWWPVLTYMDEIMEWLREVDKETTQSAVNPS